MQTDFIESERAHEINRICAIFVKETYADFSELRAESENNLSEGSLYSCSKSMRESFDRFINDLDEKLNGQYSEVVDAIIEEQSIWHLFETFLLNPTQFLSIEMAIWIKNKLLSRVVPFPASEAWNDGNKTAYWDAVYDCAMVGDLPHCSSLLKIHPKLRGITNAAASAPPAGSSAGGGGGVGRPSRHLVSLEAQGLQALEYILTSHPYASCLDNPDKVNDIISAYDQKSLSAELAVWKERVQSFFSTRAGTALIGSVPELHSLLRILGGDDAVYSEIAGAEEWHRVALAHLLYLYAPPLTRADLCRVLTSAMRVKPGKTRLRTRIEAIIHLDVGAEITSMSETLQDIRIDNTIVHLPALLSFAYVVFLLKKNQVQEIHDPNPYAPGNVSFYDSVIGPVCEDLCAYNAVLEGFDFLCDDKKDLNIAVDVLLEFIDTSQNDRYLTDTYLSKLDINSDLKAAKVWKAFTDQNLNTKAQGVYCERGKYWEIERARSHSRDGAAKGRDCNAKCFQFFKLSEEYERLAALAERTLHSCMNAVCSSATFDGIGLPTAFPLLFYDDSDNFDTISAIADPEARLDAALREASYVLKAAKDVQLYGDSRESSAAKARLGGLLATLAGYTSGVDAYLRFLTTAAAKAATANTTGTDMAAPASRGEGKIYKTSQHSIQSDDGDAVASAAEHVASLVRRETGKCVNAVVAPMRYWIHIAELALWLGERCRQQRRLSSAGIYALIVALETALASDNVLPIVRPDSGGGYSQQADRDASSYVQLRLRLLQLLDDSYLQENDNLNAKRDQMRAGNGGNPTSQMSGANGASVWNGQSNDSVNWNMRLPVIEDAALSEGHFQDLLAGDSHFAA